MMGGPDDSRKITGGSGGAGPLMDVDGRRALSGQGLVAWLAGRGVAWLIRPGVGRLAGPGVGRLVLGVEHGVDLQR
jgi:hypothetical protein